MRSYEGKQKNLNIIPKYHRFSLTFYNKNTHYPIENDEKNVGILEEHIYVNQNKFNTGERQ